MGGRTEVRIAKVLIFLFFYALLMVKCAVIIGLLLGPCDINDLGSFLYNSFYIRKYIHIENNIVLLIFLLRNVYFENNDKLS